VIDAKLLLDGCVDRVAALVDDLRSRCTGDPDLNEGLEEEWSSAREAGRTAVSFTEWREDRLTQVAVAWVLSCVFVRFCEDNELIGTRLSGRGDQLSVARDRYTGFVTERPSDDQRAYFLDVFNEMQSFPALSRLFGEHNAVWSLAPSALGCKELLEFWWRLDDDAGELVYDFADPDFDTRFLGDLYQDISAKVREKYALLQTPHFVESFILDRTLDAAIDEFGLDDTDLIDPACGSGHFLLGAFERLFFRFQQREPTANPVGHAQRALSAVAGVDLNPYAVAIARFRLVVAALEVCGVKRLADAPSFGLRVAVGDSLLHGTLPGQQDLGVDAQLPAQAYLYVTEDDDLVNDLLSRTYKAVVGNPPYITGDDAAARAAYKRRYRFCYKEYQLTVPFFELMFSLASKESEGRPAGFVGKITGNGLMKRAFGKKVVEGLFGEVDIDLLVDTSGAHLPGHATPTFLAFGRNRAPSTERYQVILGLRGEPRVPAEPEKGFVWESIVEAADNPGFRSKYVLSTDWPRGRLSTHPMVFGPGADLWFRLSKQEEERLEDVSTVIGYTAQTNADEIFLRPRRSWDRQVGPGAPLRAWVAGKQVRDYSVREGLHALFPYSETGLVDETQLDISVIRALWPYRTSLWGRATFGKKTYREEGRPWYEWHQVALHRMGKPCICFASVATHNEFALELSDPVFNRHAPFVQLPADASHSDHLELLGLLNSSTACFWMKQVMACKGNGGIGGGIKGRVWDRGWEFDGSKLKHFPVPRGSVLAWSQRLNELAKELADLDPAKLLELADPSLDGMIAATARAGAIQTEMIAMQEEIDWRVLYLFGIVPEDLSVIPEKTPPIKRGLRAFEIVMGRSVDEGDESRNSWFERHGIEPVTAIPAEWPAEYKAAVSKRIEIIESGIDVGIVETVDHKRRWSWPNRSDLEIEAARDWMLNRIERLEGWRRGSVLSVAQIVHELKPVRDAGQVAVILAGSDHDLTKVVFDLMSSDAVPHLAGLRLTTSGMRKRSEWEKVWQRQREEDEVRLLAELPKSDPRHLTSAETVHLMADGLGRPPEYSATQGDMRAATWRHRGKFDVPNERFTSYPGAEAVDGDTSAVFGWAGWDHAEQGRALATLFMQRKGTTDRAVLISLLAGVWELVPWVKQWHNEPDERGRRQGAELERFVQNEARGLGITLESLTGWAPEKK